MANTTARIPSEPAEPAILVLIITVPYTDRHKHLSEAPHSPSTSGAGVRLANLQLILYQSSLSDCKDICSRSTLHVTKSVS